MRREGRVPPDGCSRSLAVFETSYEAEMGAVMNDHEQPLTDDEALACLLAQPYD